MCNKMILLLFFCLKLSILRFSASHSGYEGRVSNPVIFLIEDELSDGKANVIQQALNKKLISLCADYYNIIHGSLEQSKDFENVIQFAVKDYYDGKPLQNFTYAGNVSKTDDIVCKKTDKVIPEYNCNEIANLVSQSLKDIDGGHIYDFVQNMNLIKLDNYRATEYDDYSSIYDLVQNMNLIKLDNYRATEYDDYSSDVDNENNFKIIHRGSCKTYTENTTESSIVLLCYKSDDGSLIKHVNVWPLTLIQIPNDECQNYLEKKIWSGSRVNFDRLLAILAPEPVEIPFEYHVPTIFYEAPYIFLENKIAFPNSINIMPWRLLKYGFLKFIQNIGWKRVAIVTDDSEYSIDFEDELTTLFSKEGLVYTVIRCEDAKCDMEKVIQELRKVEAKIVVANVEKNNAEKLLQSSLKFEWLLRDMTGKLHWKYTKNGVFSFSLRSTKSKKYNDVDDNILTGLSSITQAYNTVNRTDKIKKRKFYRRFAKELEQITPRITEVIIKVHRLHNSEEISSMFVNENGAEILTYNDPYKSVEIPSDGTAHCLVTTYDFHNPCEDPLLMFYMFTLMIFVLTLLLITCYFDKTAPLNDVRYQSF